MPSSILFAHHDGSLSGSGRSLRNLLASLDRSQFAPRVLLTQDGPVRDLYEDLGIPVDVVPAFRFGTFPGPQPYKLSWLLNWRAFLPNPALSRYLKEQDWDVLHINDKAAIAVGLAARSIHKPVVWHIRSSYFPTASRLNARISARAIRSIADHIIAISEDEVDGFEDFEPKTIIYNSVDFEKAARAAAMRENTRRALGLQENSLLVGQVSTSIGAVRGTWDFLRACGRVNAALQNPALRFMVVAAIPNRENFKPNEPHPLDVAWQIARDENIADQLTFTGFRQDALDLMAAMDVIVVCNRHGVLGRMPFEAMACGRPLVATAGHSGQSRVVVDGETALLVPPAEPGGIAAAVCRLLQEPALAERIAQQGLVYARNNFDPDKNTRKVEEIYKRLLA